MAKKKSTKPSGLRRYWPDKTLAQCEEERERMSDKQGACCAICKKPEAHFSRRLAIDHNHKTGKVRGLLCFPCNKFKVGKFTIETITPVIEYLLAYDE